MSAGLCLVSRMLNSELSGLISRPLWLQTTPRLWSAELDWHHSMAASPRLTTVSGSVRMEGGARSLTEVDAEI